MGSVNTLIEKRTLWLRAVGKRGVRAEGVANLLRFDRGHGSAMGGVKNAWAFDRTGRYGFLRRVWSNNVY